MKSTVTIVHRCTLLVFGMLCNVPAISDGLALVNPAVEIHVHTKGSADSRRVVVALVPQFDLKPSLKNTREIVQSNAQFQPFVSVAQTGSDITFPNRDDFAHHVYSFSKAMSFELPLYNSGEEHTVELSQAGIITLGCNIHDWMLGFLLVVDTPYFTFLEDNIANFSHLPSGDYQVSLWHPSMSEPWEQLLTIVAGETRHSITLPVELQSITPIPTPGDDDFGDDY